MRLIICYDEYMLKKSVTPTRTQSKSKLNTSLLSPSEISILKKLSTPIKIQDFLDTLPQNHEKKGETYMSPRSVLDKKIAHCLEGAMLAALALWYWGDEPLLLDLKTTEGDDHVIALYKKNGYWGAISKTNHATLRFRDPVYKTLRELALSYFHEYTSNKTSEKILVSFSTKPFNLKTLGQDWITDSKDAFHIANALDEAPHTSLYPKENKKFMRKADAMEQRAGQIVEWEK